MTIDLNALGQSIDTTWGRSSTPKTASFSVKFTILGGDRLQVIYQVITNFASEKEMILMKRICNEESKDVIAAYVADVKKTYKDLCGSTLKTKQIDETDSLEIIGFAVHNPKRTSYFKKKVILELA
jgi:acetate kinase